MIDPPNFTRDRATARRAAAVIFAEELMKMLLRQ